jgi:hypothetical protein
VAFVFVVILRCFSESLFFHFLLQKKSITVLTPLRKNWLCDLWPSPFRILRWDREVREKKSRSRHKNNQKEEVKGHRRTLTEGERDLKSLCLHVFFLKITKRKHGFSLEEQQQKRTAQLAKKKKTEKKLRCCVKIHTHTLPGSPLRQKMERVLMSSVANFVNMTSVFFLSLKMMCASACLQTVSDTAVPI